MPVRPKKNKRPWIKERPKKQEVYQRVRSRKEYHTARWTRESRVFREENPLCVMCKAKGIIKESEVTDHIVPAPICKDFWDKSNWQALCKKCNAEKGNKDKKLIREYKLKHEVR